MIEIIVKILALFFAIVPHEIAHGYVAYRLGDPTARDARRLTLNPLAHIDLFGSIILPLMLFWFGSPVLFGWAKPVPFNPAYFRDPRKGIMMVGAAGPVTNFILAFFAFLLVRIFGPTGYFGLFLILLCITNVILGVFNLIPIPPLDGSRVVIGLIPESLVPGFLRLERVGFIFIVILLFMGALERVLIPIARFLLTILLGTGP